MLVTDPELRSCRVSIVGVNSNLLLIRFSEDILKFLVVHIYVRPIDRAHYLNTCDIRQAFSHFWLPSMGDTIYLYPLIQSSDWYCRIAPNNRIQLSSLGKILMHLSLRLSSSFKRSIGLVLLIFFQCEGGKLRYAVIS